MHRDEFLLEEQKRAEKCQALPFAFTSQGEDYHLL